MKKSGNFIQNVFKNAKKRGTTGDCSGANYGSESCPAGSKKYNFASLMHRFAAERKSKKGY